MQCTPASRDAGTDKFPELAFFEIVPGHARAPGPNRVMSGNGVAETMSLCVIDLAFSLVQSQ